MRLTLTHFCTAQHSKIRPNFVKHFRISTILFSNFTDFLQEAVPNSRILMDILWNFSILLKKTQQYDRI